MRQILAFSLMAVFVLACDPIEEKNNNNSNTNNNTDVELCNDGIDNDGDTFTDCDDTDCGTSPACQTNNVNNTNNTNNDPGTCTPEDLPFQTQCTVGYKCTITDTADNVGCVYDDGPLSVGDACVPVEAGRTQDGCPGGSLCYAGGGSVGGCLEFCPFLYIPCGDDRLCYQTIPAGSSSAFLCVAQDECDPYLNSGCASGTCYVYISANYMTKCETAGSGLKDTPCTRPGECAPGHTCYEDACRYLCTDHGECGIEMCQKLSQNDPYGLCM